VCVVFTQHWASYHDKLDVGCLLLDHGGDLYAKDKKGLTPTSSGVAASERIAATLQMHKKEQEKWTHDNEQLIAIVSSKSSVKFQNLLTSQVCNLHTQMDQHKDEILASHESALQNIQAATETLQGQMAFLEHEYQNTKTNHHVNGDDDDDDDDKLSTPTNKKRKTKQTFATTSSTTHGGGNHGDNDNYSPRVTACEAQLEEQRAEIAALRAMIKSMNPVAKMAAAAATATTGALPEIKMEEQSAAEIGQIVESMTTAPPPLKDNEKDVLLASLEQELQRVQAELEASQETANRYKMKCEYYKDRMEQLGKLINFQP
jgi:hypothetical protein